MISLLDIFNVTTTSPSQSSSTQGPSGLNANNIAEYIPFMAVGITALGILALCAHKYANNTRPVTGQVRNAVWVETVEDNYSLQSYSTDAPPTYLEATRPEVLPSYIDVVNETRLASGNHTPSNHSRSPSNASLSSRGSGVSGVSDARF